MNIVEIPAWRKAAATYNIASDHFDDPQLSFWTRHGARAVELVGLNPGDCVLDVGCGTGSSALPAARSVGSGGRVVGIDVAENMLKKARAKAAKLNLSNIEFELADMSSVDQLETAPDAIIGVFSIFFVPDMEKQVANLWRALIPGGRLCLTVWGEGAFTPAAHVFAQELRNIRPDIPEPRRPWEQLTSPGKLRDLLMRAGTSEPEIVMVEDRQPLADYDDWWKLAMGSGYRSEIEQLHPDERKIVRSRVAEQLERRNISFVETPAIHAVAWKERCATNEVNDHAKTGTPSLVSSWL